MLENAISVSDMRDRFAEVLEVVETGRGRVLVTKYGEGRAYVVSVHELRALEESVAVLENQELLESIGRGLADLAAGRLRDASDVFAELDANFGGRAGG